MQEQEQENGAEDEDGDGDVSEHERRTRPKSRTATRMFYGGMGDDQGEDDGTWENDSSGNQPEEYTGDEDEGAEDFSPVGNGQGKKRSSRNGKRSYGRRCYTNAYSRWWISGKTPAHPDGKFFALFTRF